VLIQNISISFHPGLTFEDFKSEIPDITEKYGVFTDDKIIKFCILDNYNNLIGELFFDLHTREFVHQDIWDNPLSNKSICEELGLFLKFSSKSFYQKKSLNQKLLKRNLASFAKTLKKRNHHTYPNQEVFYLSLDSSNIIGSQFKYIKVLGITRKEALRSFNERKHTEKLKVDWYGEETFNRLFPIEKMFCIDVFSVYPKKYILRKDKGKGKTLFAFTEEEKDAYTKRHGKCYFSSYIENSRNNKKTSPIKKALLFFAKK